MLQMIFLKYNVLRYYPDIRFPISMDIKVKNSD
jgi:hypothetical protein